MVKPVWIQTSAAIRSKLFQNGREPRDGSFFAEIEIGRIEDADLLLLNRAHVIG